MSELTEHQKLQAARRKDYEMIEVPYAHLKQAITGDETLEQTKAALEKFKTDKKMKAAALRFNPALQRWLNVARDRIIRWERDNPKPEPEPKPAPKPKKKTKKVDKAPAKPDGEPESPKDLSATKEVTGSTVDAKTIKATVDPKAEDKDPDEAPN